MRAIIETMQTKAERLAVAGYAAPRLRAADEKTKNRRIALVDADGNVTGYTTLAEAQKKIFERAKIELEQPSEARDQRVFRAE